LEVSLSAAAQAEAERATVDKVWRQRLERARYNAERARRQYQLAEPENRLVVRQLEKDWESALADADRLDGEYQRFRDTRPATVTAGERDAIRALADHLPSAWHAPTTSVDDRKEILCTVIEKITVAVVGDSELVDVTIRWAGGHESTGQAVRPVARMDQLSYFPRMLARITELAEAGHRTRQIADRLNTEGLKPPKRTSRFGPDQVLHLINQHGIRLPATRAKPTALTITSSHEWSVTGLATVLGMPTASVYNWILVRVDGAGATHDLLQHLQQMNKLWRTVKFTVGWTITDADERSIAALSANAWADSLSQDGTATDQAQVAELTGLNERLDTWPDGLRLIARRTRPAARHRKKLTELEKRTGWHAEPDTLRYRLLPLPAKLATHARRKPCPSVTPGPGSTRSCSAGTASPCYP
jgi:hypothetical protein